jgi:hypothetical protein
MCGIATAHHVVSDTDQWLQPMRIHNHNFAKSILLKEENRVIFSDELTDSAVILFFPDELVFPESLIPLRPIESPLRIGADVGWVGYPHLEPRTLCFFSGNVSARRADRGSYLVDGVAINGVSGGPVIFSDGSDIHVVGIVTAYRPNRQQGDALPGLLVAQDVSPFHSVIAHIKTIDEANRKRREIEAAKKAEEEKAAKIPSPNLEPDTAAKQS